MLFGIIHCYIRGRAIRYSLRYNFPSVTVPLVLRDPYARVEWGDRTSDVWLEQEYDI